MEYFVISCRIGKVFSPFFSGGQLTDTVLSITIKKAGLQTSSLLLGNQFDRFWKKGAGYG